MRLYDKTPDKGALYYKKKFAWVPTRIGNTKVWLEYYWERYEWSNWYNDYVTSQWGMYRKLLEEHNAY